MTISYGQKWTKLQSLRATPNFTPRLLIQAESGGFEATDQNRRQFIQINGSTVVDANAPRSYLLTQLRLVSSSWSLIASNGYDVYGNASGEATAARNFLQGFSNGDMLILNTWDEPFNNAEAYLYSTLVTDFKSKINTYLRTSRDMHLLIAIKGKGVIYEEYRTRYSNSIHFSGWLN